MAIAEILRLFLFNHQRPGQVTVRKVVSRKPSSFQKEKTIRLKISEKSDRHSFNQFRRVRSARCAKDDYGYRLHHLLMCDSVA
jgi:hypothetical protein